MLFPAGQSVGAQHFKAPFAITVRILEQQFMNQVNVQVSGFFLQGATMPPILKLCA